MVFILTYSPFLLRFEQEGIGHHFEDHAGEGPHISCFVVWGSHDHLWGSVLSGLDLLGEVLVDQSGVAKVCYFEVEFVVDFNLQLLPL